MNKMEQKELTKKQFWVQMTPNFFYAGLVAIWLSDGFVVLTSKISNKPAKFIMPPVSFPELNPSNGCKDVVSCSPAPTADLMMRNYEGLNDDGKLASVLIGFNVIEE